MSIISHPVGHVGTLSGGGLSLSLHGGAARGSDGQPPGRAVPGSANRGEGQAPRQSRASQPSFFTRNHLEAAVCGKAARRAASASGPRRRAGLSGA